MTKIFQDDGMKTFLENFLSSKPADSYFRVLKKPPDKCQKPIQNNVEYTDRDELIVKLFLNKSYFTKTETIYNLTQ